MGLTITCHFCGHTWDPKNRHFICGQCHTVYDAQRCPAVGFGGEVKVARLRMNMNQFELAKILGVSQKTVERMEKSITQCKRPKSKMLKERFRIWVESTKPDSHRRKIIDDMFKETNNG